MHTLYVSRCDVGVYICNWVWCGCVPGRGPQRSRRRWPPEVVVPGAGAGPTAAAAGVEPRSEEIQ